MLQAAGFGSPLPRVVDCRTRSLSTSCPKHYSSHRLCSDSATSLHAPMLPSVRAPDARQVVDAPDLKAGHATSAAPAPSMLNFVPGQLPQVRHLPPCLDDSTSSLSAPDLKVGRATSAAPAPSMFNFVPGQLPQVATAMTEDQKRHGDAHHSFS